MNTVTNKHGEDWHRQRPSLLDSVSPSSSTALISLFPFLVLDFLFVLVVVDRIVPASHGFGTLVVVVVVGWILFLSKTSSSLFLNGWIL